MCPLLALPQLANSESGYVEDLIKLQRVLARQLESHGVHVGAQTELSSDAIGTYDDGAADNTKRLPSSEVPSPLTAAGPRFLLMLLERSLARMVLLHRSLPDRWQQVGAVRASLVGTRNCHVPSMCHLAVHD